MYKATNLYHNQVQKHIFSFSRFRGCDNTQDGNNTTIERLFIADNMVWNNENPLKLESRNGYKGLKFFIKENNGLNGFTYFENFNGMHYHEKSKKVIFHLDEYLVIVNKNNLENDDLSLSTYDSNECKKEKVYASKNKKTKSFNFDGKLYIIGSDKYLVFDGDNLQNAEDVASVVKTMSGVDKNGKTRVILDYPNILTPKRFEGIKLEKEKKEAYSFKTTEKIKSIEKIRLLNLNEDIDSNLYSFENDKVTFNKSLNSKIDTIIDNVGDTLEIKYTSAKENLWQDNKYIGSSEFLKCDNYTIYGGEQNSRVWLTGNEDMPNVDFTSRAYDPLNFPVDQNSWTKVGYDGTKIMGYAKHFDSLIVIKESNLEDGSLFLRYPKLIKFLDGFEKEVFQIKQGSVGIGAVSDKTFSYIQNEPIFLSNQGVVRITGTNVDDQRLVQDISTTINEDLMRYKSEFKDAIGLYYQGKYMLFINNICFISDERTAYRDKLGRVQYEWYKWTNLPKVEFAKVVDNTLYFGNKNILYRLKDSREKDLNNLKIDSNLSYDNEEKYSYSYINRVVKTKDTNLGIISNQKCIDNIVFNFDNREKIDVIIYAIIDNVKTIKLAHIKSNAIIDFNNIEFNNIEFGNSYLTKNIGVNINSFSSIAFEFVVGKNFMNENLTIGLKEIQIIYRNLGGKI